MKSMHKLAYHIIRFKFCDFFFCQIISKAFLRVLSLRSKCFPQARRAILQLNKLKNCLLDSIFLLIKLCRN